MAIALNLLADQQMAEELRRRDPVRRTAVGACFVVALVLVGSLFLVLRSWLASEELVSQEMQWQSLQNQNKQIIDNLRKTVEIEQRVGALTSLATNRFLWAPVLNALQHCMVDNVQIMRFKTEQTYAQMKLNPPKAKDKKTPSPETVTTERIVVTIEARDFGDQYSRFQEAIASDAFLKTTLTNGGVKLMQRSGPASDAEGGNRNYVMFTIECRFLDRTR
jgi:hypothetical protein